MKKALMIASGLFVLGLEERGGFEPPIVSLLRLISSQVHSTTLPPLQQEGEFYARKLNLPSRLLGRYLCGVSEIELLVNLL